MMKKGKSFLSIALALIVCITILSVPASANSTPEELSTDCSDEFTNVETSDLPFAKKHVELPDELKSEISAAIQAWAEDNYGEYYVLSDYEDHYYESSLSDGQAETKVLVEFNTTLRYESVEELPYMEGVKDYLNAESIAEVVDGDYAAKLSDSAAEQLQISKQAAASTTQSRSDVNAKDAVLSALPDVEPETAEKIVRIVSDQYVDAAECIGEPTHLGVDLHVTCSYDGNHADNIVLQYVNPSMKYEDISVLAPPSKEEMRSQARESLKDDAEAELKAEEEAQAIAKDYASAKAGYPGYDRIAARDYALKWSSDAAGYCNCGYLYGVNYSKWNTAEYPYYSALCHNDCADFVSQCIHAGGVRTSSTWQFGQEAWVGTISLHDYFERNRYWWVSNYNSAAAGCVMYDSSDMNHVMLVTMNDTVTHRFTAHTQDVWHCPFTNNGEYVFYKITLS